MRTRIGIYGGAFDPPHMSHVLSIAYALATMNLDRVLVVPCWNHAFGKSMSPFDDRLEMTRRAFSQLDPMEDRIIVDAIERRLKTQYTVDLLIMYKSEFPGDDLVLILGEDEWQARGQWHRWDEIEKLVQVAVIGRESMSDTGCPVRMPDISSTFIRNTIKTHGPDLVHSLVPSKVLDYIREHKIYC